MSRLRILVALAGILLAVLALWRDDRRVTWAAIAVLGVAHYWWLVKRDLTEPVIFAAVVGGLLGLRLYWRSRRQTQAR